MKLLHVAVLILVVSNLSAAILALRVNYDLTHHEVDLPLGNSSIKPPIQYLRYKPRHWAARYRLRLMASTRYQLPHTPIQYLRYKYEYKLADSSFYQRMLASARIQYLKYKYDLAIHEDSPFYQPPPLLPFANSSMNYCPMHFPGSDNQYI
ncbi:hypothetical protein OROGR_011937 [Orobanche gracilis]